MKIDQVVYFETDNMAPAVLSKKIAGFIKNLKRDGPAVVLVGFRGDDGIFNVEIFFSAVGLSIVRLKYSDTILGLFIPLTDWGQDTWFMEYVEGVENVESLQYTYDHLACWSKVTGGIDVELLKRFFVETL